MRIDVNTRYTQTAIVLHWLVAALMITNVIMAWTFDYLPDRYAQPVTDTHKSVGIIVLGLGLLRLLWRMGHQPPALLRSLPRWQNRLARTTHVALYVLMFGLPLSGWIYDSAWKDAPSYPIHFFGLFDWPRIAWVAHQPAELKEKLDSFFGSTHHILGYFLYGLFALHVAGALKHQILDKDPELQRMMLRPKDR